LILSRTLVSTLFVHAGPGFVNGTPHVAEPHDDDHSGNLSTNSGKSSSSSAAGSEGGDSERETEFIIRAGIGYDFELKNGWAITPTMDIDFAGRNEFWIVGVVIGKGF